MRKSIIKILLLTLIVFFFYLTIEQNLETKRNDVFISINDSNIQPIYLSIAVIGDPHLPEGENSYSKFRKLLLDVKSHKPDLEVLIGDFTSNPSFISDLKAHRENIIRTIALLDPLPMVSILGNYESWPDPDKWLMEFHHQNVNVMQNEVLVLKTSTSQVCVRGLGDKFTNKFVYVDFPSECKLLPKFTITHDPAGAFVNRISGLVIAGHTHCGQVSLPFIGPLWVPSDAPSSAHCGVYVDNNRKVFVTSGVGASIFPIRIGTQSQWDLISLQIN
jgi:predicted MPP superfamily phosphohydrolase